ncbi:MAG: chromate efflux transporter [Chloroflexi bacterium]|nr:chromate efflux transporter [Chloroflexota bacterium]
MASPSSPGQGRLSEVTFYFLRLGAIAFGGPAAHLAIMRRELVATRKWVTDAEFMDLVGAANLIPGPNSTEISMHLGARRAGWAGLWLGGFAFILPAVCVVLALAWAYVEYGSTPAGEGIIWGIQPFVLAIVVQAIWGLRRAAVKGWATAAAGAAVVGLGVAGVDPIALIFGAGALLVAKAKLGGPAMRFLLWLRRGGHHAVFFAVPAGYSLGELFLVFLKIGSVLYGSGYVLFAFLEADFVDSRGWLTEQQLVDAIAVGQFTPGPLFSSATFAGYVIDGVPGALVATAGIFLPSFVFVTLTYPLVPWLRRSTWAAPFLDGVNVAALALMAVVTVTLARETLDSAGAMALFAAAALVLVRWSPNTAWLVVVGAGAGLVRAAVT